MIRRTLVVGTDDLASAHGGLFCRDLSISTPDGSLSIRRGTPLDDRLSAALASQIGTRVEVVLPEPGELAQENASERFARAVIGPGLTVERPHQGQCIIHSATTGVLRVSADRVVRINRQGIILLATALDGRLVSPGDTVAIVKAAHLWTPAERLEEILRTVGPEPILRTAGFTAQTAAFVAGPRIRPRNVQAADQNLRALLAPFGIELATTIRCTDEPADIAAIYQRLIDQQTDLIFVAGSIVLDPADPFLLALEHVGAILTCRGAPIDPGTMFWAARAASSLILGLASCELYGRRSILDLLLPYAAAREPIDQNLLAELGYGGLLDQTFSARRS